MYRPGMLGVNTDLGYGAAPVSYSDVGAGAGTAAGGGSMAASLGAAGIVAGGSALSGMLQALYQQELEKKKREQEAMMAQSQAAGQYGQNQQQMLAQILAGHKTALGV